jgi:hypothetical protein
MQNASLEVQQIRSGGGGELGRLGKLAPGDGMGPQRVIGQSALRGEGSTRQTAE